MSMLLRLDLMGYLILCRLIVAIIEGLRGDTTLTQLAVKYGSANMFSVWIYSLEKEFKKFVRNRVLEIFKSIT